MIAQLDRTLEGRKGLVVGIANAHSIAYGCARPSGHWGPSWRSPISTTRPGPTSSLSPRAKSSAAGRSPNLKQVPTRAALAPRPQRKTAAG